MGHKSYEIKVRNVHLISKTFSIKASFKMSQKGQTNFITLQKHNVLLAPISCVEVLKNQARSLSLFFFKITQISAELLKHRSSFLRRPSSEITTEPLSCASEPLGCTSEVLTLKALPRANIVQRFVSNLGPHDKIVQCLCQLSTRGSISLDQGSIKES